MDVCETKNMELFNKGHIFEPMISHIYEPNISLTSRISLMFNYAKNSKIMQKIVLSYSYALKCVMNLTTKDLKL